MRRIAAVAIFAVIIAFALSASASAGTAKMVFWYPGEAGSTAEAQPVLDAFFQYVSGKLGGQALEGRYFNTVKGGIGYLVSKKPIVGIVSHAAFVQNRARLAGSKPILATLPMPGGRPTEKYSIFGTGKEIPPGATIYSSEPMSISFVKSELFPNIPDSVKLEQTDKMFVKLKTLANEKNAFAILTPTEAGTLKRLKSDWAKPLKTVETSKAVPTARVILLDPKWKEAGKFTEALLKSGTDPSAQEILEELRLKGFARIH